MRPHATSNSAQQLAWTFAIENALIEAALRNELRMPPAFPAMPDRWDDCVQAYDDGVRRVIELLQSAREEEMGDMVPFMTGPRHCDWADLYCQAAGYGFAFRHHRGGLGANCDYADDAEEAG
jgi:hypothetical protein